MPRVGDLAIVRNWSGEPKAIIITTKVEIVKFRDITVQYCQCEGEGDKSLDYWKKVHWNYYKNEMKKFGEYPNEILAEKLDNFESVAFIS